MQKTPQSPQAGKSFGFREGLAKWRRVLEGDYLMEYRIQIEYKERERDALQKLAKEMVEAAEQRGRELSPGEDGMVLELLRQANVLEHQIAHLRREEQHLPPEQGGGEK